MKISFFFTAAYYFTAALTIIQQIEAIAGQLPILEQGDSSSYFITPEVP